MLTFQYKDAFFSANPNFKWYKLPAPPLRTLSTRPGNTDRPLYNYPYDADSFTSDSIHRTTCNTQFKEDLLNRGPNVGIFKFADEAQMGGLNSLMASYDSKSLSGNNNLGEHDAELGMNELLVLLFIKHFSKKKSFLRRQFLQSIKSQANANQSN